MKKHIDEAKPNENAIGMIKQITENEESHKRIQHEKFLLCLPAAYSLSAYSTTSTYTHTHIPIHLFCTPPLFIYFIKYQHTHNLKAQATDSVVCFNIPCCCRFFFAFFALFLSLCLSRCLLQTESSAHLFIINPVFLVVRFVFVLLGCWAHFFFFFG